MTGLDINQLMTLLIQLLTQLQNGVAPTGATGALANVLNRTAPGLLQGGFGNPITGAGALNGLSNLNGLNTVLGSNGAQPAAGPVLPPPIGGGTVGAASPELAGTLLNPTTILGFGTTPTGLTNTLGGIRQPVPGQTGLATPQAGSILAGGVNPLFAAFNNSALTVGGAQFLPQTLPGNVIPRAPGFLGGLASIAESAPGALQPVSGVLREVSLGVNAALRGI